MGQLDQFAKDTFAEETPAVTHGGVSWQLPPEVGLTEVRLDGLLRVHDRAPLAGLAAPWSHVEPTDELVLEVAMPGNHVDILSFDRACLRRLARQVQRREDPAAPFEGETTLWYLASHVSATIKERRPVACVGPGCYRIGPDWMSTLWIAANELPLADELVPFLIARTGQPLDAFVRWVKTRRSIPWLVRMLQWLPMSAACTKTCTATRAAEDRRPRRPRPAQDDLRLVRGSIARPGRGARAEGRAEGGARGRSCAMRSRCAGSG